MTADRRTLNLFLIVVAGLTLVRLVQLMVSATDLYVDEAQYAVWAQTPAWGYYSKPPMIGWLIAGSAAVCGWSEPCVRAPSTLVWAGTSVLVFLAADALFGRRVAWFAGLSTLLAPGAAYSARIISTDAPLLLFWSLSLLAFVRLRAGGGWAWAAALGVGVGLGMLSKYAMAYFLGGLVLAAVFDRDSRRALLSWKALAALGVAALVMAPNVMWNLMNGLATARHTGDNVSGGGLTPGIADPLEFFATQFVLAGPVAFAGFLLAAWRWKAADARTRLLLAISLPVLAVVLAVATLTRAHGNWAAVMLPAVWILGAAWAVERGREGWLKGGLVFGVALQALLFVADVTADRIVINDRAPFGRTLGWEVFTDRLMDEARLAGGRTLVAERRAEVASVAHYGQGGNIPIKAWPGADPNRPEDHFQMSRPLTLEDGFPVIAVAPCEDSARFANSFARVEPLGRLATPMGRGRPREVWLYRLSEPRGVVLRPGDCPG